MAFVAGLSACGPRSGITVPDGLVVANDGGASSVAHGLWISLTPDDPSCCWLAPTATVTANKTAEADMMVVTVVVPAFKFFADGGQTVTVSVDGQSTTFPGLKPGNHVLTAKLDGKLRPFVGSVDVVIRSARTFVPIHEGVNGDTRHFGVLLKGVTFT